MAPKHTLEHVREHARKYNAPLPKYSLEKFPVYVSEWVEETAAIIDFMFISILAVQDVSLPEEKKDFVKNCMYESLQAIAKQVYMFAERTPNTVTKSDRERPFALLRRLPKDAESRSQEIREMLRASTNNDERALLQEALENFDHVRRAQTGRYFNKLVSDQEWFKVLPADAATIATALYEDLFEPSSQHLLSTHKDPATRIDALLEQHARFAREKAATIGLTEENSAEMPPQFIEGKQYGPEEKKYTLRVLNDARHLAVEGQLMNNCVVSRADQLVLADQEGDAGFTKKRNMLVFSLSVELPEPDTIAHVRGVKANDIPKEKRFANASLDEYKVTRKSELTFEYDVWTGHLGEVKRQDNKPFPTDESDPLYQAFFEVLRDLNEELKHRYRGRGIQSFGGDLQHLKPKNGGFRTITNKVKSLDMLEEGDVVVAGDEIVVDKGTSAEDVARFARIQNVVLNVSLRAYNDEMPELLESRGSLLCEASFCWFSALTKVQGDLTVDSAFCSLPSLREVNGKTHIDSGTTRPLVLPKAVFRGDVKVVAQGAVDVPTHARFLGDADFRECDGEISIPDEVFKNAEGNIYLHGENYETYVAKFPDKVKGNIGH